jgi:hypothetical protein
MMSRNAVAGDVTTSDAPKCQSTSTTTTSTEPNHQDNVSHPATAAAPIHCLPAWHYRPPNPSDKPNFDPLAPPKIDDINLGDYVRYDVTNLDEAPPNDGRGRDYFNMGLRLMLSYQHELAARCFIACLELCKYCALAHGLVALCNAPNYNFKGEAYYESAHHPEEEDQDDLLCNFPSQQVAERHSKMGVDLIEEIRKLNRSTDGSGAGGGTRGGKKGKFKKKGSKGGSSSSNKPRSNNNNTDNDQQNENETSPDGGESSSSFNIPTPISDVETQLLIAIRILTCHPGLEHTLADDIVGKL